MCGSPRRSGEPSYEHVNGPDPFLNSLCVPEGPNDMDSDRGNLHVTVNLEKLSCETTGVSLFCLIGADQHAGRG